MPRREDSRRRRLTKAAKVDGAVKDGLKEERRRPRRRAVVVGCNYPVSQSIRLQGCVNDAHLFALALTNLFEFHPENILLLTDELPDPVFLSKKDQAEYSTAELASSLPTRTHIMLGLKWLTMGAIPGDVLVFYFAGHGLQVDNMAGWEGEGYDESILPFDCAHASGDVNAITAVSIRHMLLSCDESVQLSIFLDCTGGQTMLDPAGTGSWKYIRGVKQKGLWPFVTDPTFKMERARYDPNVWTAECMRKRDVRPRFVPGAEVGNVQDLVGAMCHTSLENPSSKLRGFHICAAPWDEVAIEGRLPSLGLRALSPTGHLSSLPVIAANKPIKHGLFTWSIVRAMNDCAIGSAKAYNGDKTISFRTLLRESHKHMQYLKEKQGFIKANQCPSLTCYMASGSSPTDLVFFPFGGKSRSVKYSDATELDQLNRKEHVWLPNRGDYITAWEAEASMSVNGQLTRRMSLKAQHNRYKEMWKHQAPSLLAKEPSEWEGMISSGQPRTAPPPLSPLGSHTITRSISLGNINASVTTVGTPIPSPYSASLVEGSRLQDAVYSTPPTQHSARSLHTVVPTLHTPGLHGPTSFHTPPTGPHTPHTPHTPKLGHTGRRKVRHRGRRQDISLKAASLIKESRRALTPPPFKVNPLYAHSRLSSSPSVTYGKSPKDTHNMVTWDLERSKTPPPSKSALRESAPAWGQPTLMASVSAIGSPSTSRLMQTQYIRQGGLSPSVSMIPTTLKTPTLINSNAFVKHTIDGHS